MTSTFDDLVAAGSSIQRHEVEFLPDPAPAERRYLIISVDDHVCEARDTFTARVPRKFRDLAPRVVTTEDGSEAWLVQGETRRWTGGDSVVGRPIESMDDLLRSLSYADMRAGTYDIHSRIRDMDLDGVYASVNFPSMVWGFCGQKVWGHSDPELAQACVRAYNDWMAEEWAGPYPDRIIPSGIVYMPDPVIAAEEIRRNAARGFKSVHFSENPEKLGLPSIHTRHWDPIYEACQETGTVINLHLGSSSTRPSLSSDTPLGVTSLLWPAQTMSATADWVYSQVAARYAELKIVTSEGGVGWVPMLRERMERAFRRRSQTLEWDWDVTPAEVLMRNFWFCSIEEPRTMKFREEIGIENIMIESDYPHSDTSWPETQERVHEAVSFMRPEEIAKITHENAAHVYRHALPTAPEWCVGK